MERQPYLIVLYVSVFALIIINYYLLYEIERIQQEIDKPKHLSIIILKKESEVADENR